MKDIQFDCTTAAGTTGVLIYSVPDNTEISEWDAEYDAEQASMEAGTYPPRFVPELRTVRVIIHEYERDKIIGTTEITGESFQEVSTHLMKELILSWPISQVVSAMVKWFGGPPMVGDNQPFAVRQYESTVGFWTDFLYRP